MWGFQRLAGTVVWSALIVARWFHACFIAGPAQWWLDNVVGTAEESTKATVREYFGLASRVINGIASWIVAIFIDRDFHRTKGGGREAHRRSKAWKAFWAQNARAGTLNAVIEQEGFISPSLPSTSASAQATRSPRPKIQRQSNSGWLRWAQWSWWGSGGASTTTPRSPTKKKGMRRSGSDLFRRPSGYAADERMEKRGLVEGARVSVEIAIGAVFNAFRSAVSTVLMLRSPGSGGTAGGGGGPAALNGHFDDEGWFTSRPKPAPQHPQSAAAERLRRTKSFGSWEDRGVWTAADVILQAGYPLEEEMVTTSDGYVLCLQRIPRKDSREVVFFQHGVFDTSLGWVANGPEGSQAFAAYDAGADVWLGNSRANPPRAHADSARSGSAYWPFSINELGMEDVAAQVYRIHAVKTAELEAMKMAGGVGSFMSSVVGGSRGGGGAPTAAAAVGGGPAAPSAAAATPRHKRSGSDSALASRHLLEMAVGRMGLGKGGEGAAQAPNEAQIKKFNLAAAAAEAGGEGNAGRGGAQGDGGDAVQQQQQQQRQSVMSMLRLPPRWSRRAKQRGTLSAQRVHSFPILETEPDSPCGASPEPLTPRCSLEERGSASNVSSGGVVCEISPVEEGEKDAAAGPSGSGSGGLQRDPSEGVLPPMACLMTPDRVSFGGKEQEVPLEWAPSVPAPSAARAALLSSSSPELYRLQAVGHSLGGGALLIYAVMCRVLGRPHHLSRLILLTPAGFHRRYPKVAAPFLYILPVVMRLLNWYRPGVGAPVYIPSSLMRYITFKLTVDMQQVPALNELTRAGLRLLLNGDASEWDRALQMPHYAVASMPAISLHTGAHLIQLMLTGKFQLFDYGSAAANRKHYGTDTPPDVAEHYHLLKGLPVDLVAGRSDGVIAQEDVGAHYHAMQKAGLDVTLKELDVGHLDMTFAAKDDVKYYVMSRLGLRGARAAAMLQRWW